MSNESQVVDLREEEEGGRASVCVVVAVVVVSVVLGNIQIETAVNLFLSSYQKR